MLFELPFSHAYIKHARSWYAHRLPSLSYQIIEFWSSKPVMSIIITNFIWFTGSKIVRVLWLTLCTASERYLGGAFWYFFRIYFCLSVCPVLHWSHRKTAKIIHVSDMHIRPLSNVFPSVPDIPLTDILFLRICSSACSDQEEKKSDIRQSKLPLSIISHDLLDIWENLQKIDPSMVFLIGELTAHLQHIHKYTIPAKSITEWLVSRLQYANENLLKGLLISFQTISELFSSAHLWVGVDLHSLPHFSDKRLY